MATRLERALEAGFRIRPGEQRRVALMAFYAANAIGAVVVGRSVRDALYLAKLEERGGAAHGLAGMYIWSSLAIVSVSWLYGRVADKVPRGALNAASSFILASLCACFWAVLSLHPSFWVYAGLYIFVEAMGSLVVIQFWTMANEVFHAREAKRLFGLIGGGGTLANVVFGLLVGKYAKVWGAPNLLWIMVCQLCLCAVMAKSSSRLASPAAIVGKKPAPIGRAPLLSRAGLSFLNNRHLAIVAFIGTVSAAAVTIVDYQFKLQAASVLHQNELAGYFGRFYGICGGIALVIQIWVTGRVLERYGILASLLPLPIGIATGSIAGAMVPGNLYASSLAKGSDTVFRYTINDASMQLLYVPVQPHVRGRAKAFIDGILKPISIALTGALLLFYKQAGGEGRPLVVAIVLLVALWMLLLVRARTEYVKSLVESLERRHLDLSMAQFAAVNETTLKALRTALTGDAGTVLHALTLVQQLAQAADFSPELRGLLAHPDARVRASALQILGELRRSEALPEMRALLADSVPEVRAAALGAVCAVEQEGAVPVVLPFLQAEAQGAPNPAVVRAAAAVALIRYAGLDGVLAAADPLKQLLAAADPLDRAAAADALGNIGVRGFFRPLLAFLRDPDPFVRRRAIAAAGKLRSPELLPALIEQLQRRDVLLEGVSALVAYGPGVEGTLATALCDESIAEPTRRGLALVLQRLGTREAAEGLVGALSSKEPGVRKAAARALSRVTRRQRELRIDRAAVEVSIHRELLAAQGALSALKKLALPVPSAAPRTPGELLWVALCEERDARIFQALVLLEVLLPQVRLDVVAENLRSESAAQRGNAIEVLDNALPEPWKHLVMAALDETKRRGDAVLPDARTLEGLLSALISGEAGPWVSAVAARWSLDASVRLAELLPAMRTALRSPYAPLREAAALALARETPQDAHGLLSPLADDVAASVSRTVRALLRPRAIA